MDAIEIARAFQAPGPAGEVTGYQMPYTIVVRPDGGVEQALAIGDVGPHARAWNIAGVGVALVGDQRHEAPPKPQYDALIWVCTVFAGWLGGAAHVFGHDELKGGSANARKECPGDKLDLQRLRGDIGDATASAVTKAGFVM